MVHVVPALRLTHRGALAMLQKAIEKADELGKPVDIVIVDEGGNVVASVRMDGAKFLSMKTALTKARTAASHRRPTTAIGADMAAALALASGGGITGMAGGLPIMVAGACIGGIGVGSAPDEDDVAIATAALAALEHGSA
jgi:uncharacterized protein GlcG (DUF336 family)